MLEKRRYLFIYSLWLSDWSQRRLSWRRSEQSTFASLRKTFADPNKFVRSLCLEHGQQSTAEGSVESLMGFISRVRLLEANGYAARKNFVKKKYKDDTARKDIELRKINTRMEETKTWEDPAIARAMSRMVDHQGWWVLKNVFLERGKRKYSLILIKTSWLSVIWVSEALKLRQLYRSLIA